MSASTVETSSLRERIHPFVGTKCRISANESQRPKLGLPPRPEREALRQAWDCTFEGELQHIQYFPSSGYRKEQGSSPQAGGDSKRQDRSRAPRRPDAAGPPVARRYESSLNWSGAYLLPTPGKRFVQIWGSWTVPEVVPNDRNPQGEYQCSTWIGLDGQRRYGNSTLPQIGTLQTVNSSDKPAAIAWVQWWQRNDPRSTPEYLWNFPVAPGDSIGCVLTLLTKANCPSQTYDQSVLFNIVNQTQRYGMAMRIDPPPVEQDNPARVWISGATAAWIMERPAILQPEALQNLADYGTTEFVNCVGAEAAETLHHEPIPRDLTNPWSIRMYEVLDKPYRIGFISRPISFEQTKFAVSYTGQTP